jgi:hypothetical protein
MTWDVYLWKSIIIAAVIIFIIYMFTSGVNSLNASIAGYSLLIITILGIMIQFIRKPVTNQEGTSTLKMVMNILTLIGPFFIILAIIGFMLYLLISYKNPIINNQVSQSFKSFSNLTVFLIIITMYFIYNNIMCDGPQCGNDTGKIDKVSNSVLFLLSLITMIFAGTVYVILVFYTTDGFQVLNTDSGKMQFNYLL